MTMSKTDVAVFVDFENIYVSVREKFDATPNFESIMERCEDYGRVVIARAYADWYRYPRITSALFANGIEPMYVPTYYYDKEVGRQGRPIKNSVDMHLCIDVMRTLYSRANIQRYILVTGDRDFIPLVNTIRQEGKEVVIIGIGGAASSHLAQSADEFLFYEQIVDIKPMTPPVPAPMESRNDRAERRAEKAPEKAPEKAAESPEVFSTLVEAIQLARRRGYVCSFGSLKVLMKELLPNFKESRYRDSSGKPFVKFTDFVREAERQGHVQIFTSGTVNEVFLPGEDPYKLSQFAADLPSAEVERELEAELIDEAALQEARAGASSRRNGGRDRRRDRGRNRQAEYTSESESGEPSLEEPAAERVVPTFGEREWQLFFRAMSAFSEPTPFAEIFNQLRELRNSEELALTNQELKELLKQAINQGLLQRSNRGAKAHYRLQDSYRTAPQFAAVGAPLPAPSSPQAETPEEAILPDLEDLELPFEEQPKVVEAGPEPELHTAEVSLEPRQPEEIAEESELDVIDGLEIDLTAPQAVEEPPATPEPAAAEQFVPEAAPEAASQAVEEQPPELAAEMTEAASQVAEEAVDLTMSEAASESVESAAEDVELRTGTESEVVEGAAAEAPGTLVPQSADQDAPAPMAEPTPQAVEEQPPEPAAERPKRRRTRAKKQAETAAEQNAARETAADAKPTQRTRRRTKKAAERQAAEPTLEAPQTTTSETDAAEEQPSKSARQRSRRRRKSEEHPEQQEQPVEGAE